MTVPDVSVTVGQVNEPGRSMTWRVLWREPRRASGTARKRRCRYFATQDEANRFKADLLAELVKEVRQAAQPAPTVAGSIGGMLATWLKDHVKPKKDAATWRCYDGLSRIHLVPAPFTVKLREAVAKHVDKVKAADDATFGDLPTKVLMPAVIKRLYEDLYDRGVSLGTRRLAHATLSSACAWAVGEGILMVNPCLGLGRQLRHTDEADADAEPNPFTKAEWATIQEYVALRFPDWIEYFTFLGDTGVRVGEAAALKWDRVNLNTGFAHIVKSWSASAGKDKDPKTHQRRWVELSDRVVTQLTGLRERERATQARNPKVTRLTRDGGYVFAFPNGNARGRNNVNRLFNRILLATHVGYEERKGKWHQVNRHTPHDIRDTFATLHLEQDWTRKLPWVSRQLGHETEQTTVNHYVKIRPADVGRQFANDIV